MSTDHFQDYGNDSNTPSIDELVARDGAQRELETWPEWTCITTPWNDPGGEDPDEYNADCFRCQAISKQPNHASGTRAEMVSWAQGHSDDPEPTQEPGGEG